MKSTAYNPLDRANLGRSVAEALLEKTPIRLKGIESFRGCGIYALYYTGSNPAYVEIAKRNNNGKFLLPIYVGKAVPKGSRKGADADVGNSSFALSKRLQEHEASIKDAENHPTQTLTRDDFWCRYLVVEDIWIPLGESLLIAMYSPIWNTFLDGFGNHDPGRGRHQGMRPRWDILHPGRSWADRLQPRPDTQNSIMQELRAQLRLSNLPPMPKA